MAKLDQFMALPYSIQIVPGECTDGSSCYLARVMELDGCESHGDTPQEALENLEEAKRLFLMSLLEDGIEPPLPAAATRAS
jgi:antitoxin HicB